jgi:Asp-tRNA(Asn)/Glu-tRNA(Gln) amidotransferase A subunit family amidase
MEENQKLSTEILERAAALFEAGIAPERIREILPAVQRNRDFFRAVREVEIGDDSATDYIKGLRVRTLLQDEMARVFETCDVMAVPGNTQLPSKLDDEVAARSDVKPGAPSGVYRGGNTFLGNMTGLPAITVPCGLSKGPPPLPISIQFYGRPFDEATILRVAHAYESATDWHRRRPPLA